MKLVSATRRGATAAALTLAALLAATAAQPAHADSASAETTASATNHAEHGRVMGDPDAPVTIVEFASLTCPHCRQFHEQTLPKLKKNWIEPGKAKLVYRHYPLDRPALRGAMIANCFEGDRFFAVIDMMFENQGQWSRAEQPTEGLARIAATAGMDKDTFESCANDGEMADSIVEQQLAARKQIGVESTPTFLVDGEKLVGNQPYENFVDALEAAE